MASALEKRLKELIKKVPPHDEVMKFLGGLNAHEGHAFDRAAALVGTTLIEDALRIALLSNFVNLDPDEEQFLFDGERGGPLALFTTRIRVAHALGIIGESAQVDLRRMRIIRNTFAHGALELHFETPEIANIVAEFKLIDAEKSKNLTTKQIFTETVALISEQLRKIPASGPNVMMIPGVGAVAVPEPKSPRRLP